MDRSTSPVVNRTQAVAWNGPEGAHWAKHAAVRRPGADLVDHVLEAAEVAVDARVLDVGCGTGELTRLAAREARSGSALGVDLSQLMIDEARMAAWDAGLANATFAVADAQVHPFPAAGFDVAVSHFGVMFFADPAAAFANLAAAIRPGGRLAFVCPQAMERCTWYGAPLGALLGHEPTPAVAPSAMFSLADPSRIETLVRDAGFGAVDVRPVEHALWFGADVATAAEFYVGSGPVRGLLERHGMLTEAAARCLLASAMEQFLTDDGVRLPGHHWLVTARRSPAG